MTVIIGSEKQSSLSKRLADARQNGTDSRYFGAVQKNEIVGTVITIVRRNNL